MKRLIRPVILISVSLLIVLFSAAVTFTAKIPGPGYSTTAAYFLQTTPTAPVVEEDRSVVGSTDGIVVMGGVIALIVMIPIIVKYKSWMPTEQN